LVLNPHRCAPITAGTHTDGGAVTVIRKPGSAWLEGAPAMDLGHMNVALKWIRSHAGFFFVLFKQRRGYKRSYT